MDFEAASIPMGRSGPYSELIYLVGMGYESLIGSRFTFMHNDVLVITQACLMLTLLILIILSLLSCCVSLVDILALCMTDCCVSTLYSA